MPPSGPPPAKARPTDGTAPADFRVSGRGTRSAPAHRLATLRPRRAAKEEGLVAVVAALKPSLPAYLAFLDVCLTRRAACFARLDAGALAVLPGFATGAFLATLTGAFNFGSAATAVSASAVTVARTCSRVRVQIELAVASDVSTPLPRTRIACVSTTDPSLISAGRVLPARF